MKTQRRGNNLTCPHCGKSDGELVDDYVVPKSFEPTTESCSWCDREFSVTEVRNSDEFLVDKL